MHNNRHNRKTVIIPQTIIVPTNSIIIASLVCARSKWAGINMLMFHFDVTLKQLKIRSLIYFF